MTSIQLLGGKQKLLTIQVSSLVHLQSVINWARLLKKHAGFTVALLTSLGLLVFLFTQFHDKLNRSGTRNPSPPSDAGQDIPSPLAERTKPLPPRAAAPSADRYYIVKGNSIYADTLCAKPSHKE